MPFKYKNKYRIESARARWWDYGCNSIYFITICTREMYCYFGEISDDKMHLNEIGSIVESQWLKTFEMRPDMNLFQGHYVVMPNHFHAILGIGVNVFNSRMQTNGNGDTDEMAKNQFGPQSKNLASIIRGFKAGVTSAARLIHADFAWQSRYHEHIVKDDQALKKISHYIINNPVNWPDDKFFNG